MKFSNRENIHYRIEGKDVRDSRSVAVESVLFFHCDGKRWVPLIHRGHMEGLDSPGMHALAGGYMDWDESGFDALRREVREETGLDLQGLQDSCSNRESAQQPYRVKTAPVGNRQNIVLWYALVFDVGELPSLQPQVDPIEIQSANWYLVEDAIQMELAFGHHNLIQERWEKLLT